MNFKDQLFHSSLLFSENSFLKFINKITLENVLFVNKSINRQVPLTFYDWFTFSGDLHRHETCWSVTDHLNIPTFWTQNYGHFSMRASTIYLFLELYAQSLNKKFITQKLNFGKNEIFPY